MRAERKIRNRRKSWFWRLVHWCANKFGYVTDSLISVCCVCHGVYGIKRGIGYRGCCLSHGYCSECYKKEIKNALGYKRNKRIDRDDQEY
jgi:hypothetical protein